MLRTLIYTSTSHSPHETLALEEALLESLRPDEAILYMYEHAPSVIIGRNQNAWAECRPEKLSEDGITLARRITGGGAVYHDEGNLNFSFIVPRIVYDVERQCRTILNAMQLLGIEARLSGRNDILANGRKFSGNAFCVRRDAAVHHGTLLINTDLTRMQTLLTPNPEKLRAKGVSSVRSRVRNLAEIVPTLSNGRVLNALSSAFFSEYGEGAPLCISPAVEDRARELAERNSTWDWIYGRTPEFDIELSGRFDWGSIQLNLVLDAGRISCAQIYSDSLEPDFISQISPALLGAKYDADSVAGRLAHLCSTPPEREIAQAVQSLIPHTA